MTTQHPTHDCPGGCGAQVLYRLFACRACWRKLPADLQQRITELHRVDPVAHRLAMSEARKWYDQLTAGGAP